MAAYDPSKSSASGQMLFPIARGAWIPCRPEEAVMRQPKALGTYSCILEKALRSILDNRTSGAKINVI